MPWCTVALVFWYTKRLQKLKMILTNINITLTGGEVEASAFVFMEISSLVLTDTVQGSCRNTNGRMQ